MPPALANYTFLFRRTAKFLGVADPNYPEGDEVIATAPYTKDMIKKQIVQSDVEVCALIASSEKHPYRNKFFTAAADAVVNGARIPEYIGVHGGVEVNISGWKRAKLAQSLEHLQRVQEKYAIAAALIPASSQRLYWIDNGILHYIDAASSARITLPVIPLADDTAATPTLSTPKVGQYAVLAHAIFTLNPVGADSSHRMNWATIWAGYVQMIISGEAQLPDPERMQRIAN